MRRILGIDVGGSGVKGAIVNVHTGHLLSPRYRVKTPRPATPQALAAAIARVAAHFSWKGRIGVGMPGPLKDGRLMLARNLDRAWSGVRAHGIYREVTGLPVYVVNDADAAGLAEMRFGSGRKQRGTVVLITLGTGIGSAVFVDGKLLPNTELGQMEIRGKRAEERAAARVRKEKNLSWEKYTRRLQEYLDMVQMLLWPDLIIVGGGVSRKAKRFIPRIKLRAAIVPARLRNEAGIIGAALYAAAPRGR